MARTYENLISECREYLQDEDTPYRFSDTKLLNALNRGLLELGRIRPDAFTSFYDANSLNIPIIVDDDAATAPEYDWATAFQLDMMYYTPLLTYIVGVIELIDDEFTLEGRAVLLLQQFQATVTGV